MDYNTSDLIELFESLKIGGSDGNTPQGPSKRVGLVYDERMMAHKDPEDPDHVEQPSRISRIYEKLEKDGLAERCVRVPARKATKEELESVHEEKHVDFIDSLTGKDINELTELSQLYNSIYFNESSTESALLSAGSLVEVPFGL